MEAVNALVQQTLETLGVPVIRQFFDGTSDRYITYQLTYVRDREYEDDENAAVEYTFGADIYAKRDPDALVQAAKEALKVAGFMNVTVEAEIYESGTKYYHIPLQFNYTEVV